MTDDDRPATDEPGVPPASGDAAEGVAEDAAGADGAEAPAPEPTAEDLFYANAVRSRTGTILAVVALLLVALVLVLVITLAGDEDAQEDPARRPPPINSPLALQSQVRAFADAWVGGDLTTAATYAGACAEEQGVEGATDVLRATLELVEAAYGVPAEQLSVRRVVTRNVAGGQGDARIDFDPEPFEDPLDAVGRFLPWRLDGTAWELSTCTFGASEDVPEDPDAPSRADLIRSLLDEGYGEELSICVSDALIAEFGLEALVPGQLSEEQDSFRLASEATCRSVPTQAGEGFGTPDNPVPLGSVGRVGEWDARVVDLIPNATEIVMDAFDFNTPPPEGEQFVMVRLELTYRGEQADATLLDLGFRLETTDGRTYNEFDDTCGLFPDEIDQVAVTAPGATLAGTMCWSVADEDVEGLELLLDSLVTLEDSKVWFAVG